MQQSPIPLEQVPLQFNVQQLPTAPLVMLTVHSPMGSAFYFVDAEAATALGAELTRIARATGAGLTLPNNVTPITKEPPK